MNFRTFEAILRETGLTFTTIVQAAGNVGHNKLYVKKNRGREDVEVRDDWVAALFQLIADYSPTGMPGDVNGPAAKHDVVGGGWYRSWRTRVRKKLGLTPDYTTYRLPIMSPADYREYYETMDHRRRNAFKKYVFGGVKHRHIYYTYQGVPNYIAIRIMSWHVTRAR